MKTLYFTDFSGMSQNGLPHSLTKMTRLLIPGFYSKKLEIVLGQI